MSLKIICLGKTRESWIQQGIEEYHKRLNPHWKIDWLELKDTSLKTAGSISKVKQLEAQTLLKAISERDYLIALDEKGRATDSVSFAKELSNLINDRDVVFVIGGVYGLDKALLDKADRVLSCSGFTFPHQLIRVILMEQLYRAWTISSGKTYHY
ncbi:MAG: 23S rRNA (pseudouridine(1915)-N(3))-methyltransferase RlmH [Candidatus Cloacimonadaceae bacterium]